MGILTNIKTRQKLVSLLANQNNKLCFLLYVAGVIWFLALAYRPFNAGTYFSENALLPGLVDANFHHDHGAPDIYKSLKEELNVIKKSSNKEAIYRIPTSWFEEQFRSIGLDTYVQNYTFKYPAGILGNHVFHGQNVYGILRAPRAASTEAFVLSVPYRPPEAGFDKTNNGVALMIALARSFRQHTYWAKDIIFLATEHESIGIRAWLSAYHNDHNEYILADELHGRSGSIQAALNLEIGSESIHRFNIKLEGLNGQLPNLDLVNTVVRFCERENINPTLQKRLDTWDTDSWNGFKHNLGTMMAMMLKQAPGSPSGNHGLFHRYHIEAVTLQGVRLKSSRPGNSYREMGRVVEGVCRSLNNLQERFHQSFFFYLLPTTNRYVSIGLYMPPFGLIAAPILVKALALWVTMAITEDKAKGTGKSKKKTDDNSETEESTKGAGDGVNTKEKGQKEVSKRGLLSVLPVCMMCMMFGFAALHGPHYFTDAGRIFYMRPAESLFWGAIALHVSAMFFPRILKRKSRKDCDSLGPDPALLKCLGLLVVAVVVVATSLMNISLAVIITTIWTPVLLLIYPSKRRLVNLLQYVLLLVVSPLGLFYLASVGGGLVAGVTAPVELHTRAWDVAQQGLLTAIVDGSLLGSWTYSLVSLAIFPTWLLFWALLWTEPL